MYEFQGPLPWEEHMTISASDIRNMSSTATARIIAGIVDHQQAIADGGIDTPLRLCHFMAQLAHESAHFQVTREFASGAAYEGRKDLGNTHAGDGKRYRGRGLIQTTGRANYQEAAADIKHMNPASPDFEAEPEALEEFPWALLAGISFWRRKKINAAADRDDVVAVTKIINGGKNGLEERKKYLAKAKAIWMSEGSATATGATVTESGSDPVLRPRDRGEAVTKLQNALIEAGFAVSTDGAFGEHTKSAVIAFQTSHGLTADGVVGAGTWAELRAGAR
jgi:putative chitinase